MEATTDSVKRAAKTNTLRGRRIASTSDDIRATCIVVFRVTIIVLSVGEKFPSLHLLLLGPRRKDGKTAKLLPKERQ